MLHEVEKFTWIRSKLNAALSVFCLLPWHPEFIGMSVSTAIEDNKAGP